MNMDLQAIQAPIEKELKEFEIYFREAMKSQVSLLDRITYYIVKRKGKQIRPMFVFFSAQLVDVIKPATFTAAALVEIIHTATLVHDDIVDESMQRRGFFSINALWKNKIAVLVGDYLFAKGLDIALKENQYEILSILNSAIKELSEGELLQIEKARKLDITEAVYFDIIRQKTASLIAASCAAGAASVTTDKTMISRIKQIGEWIGIAFQIKDDLFDYGDDAIGKPTGIDIKEKKMTLPLIYTLHHTDRSTKSEIINIVRNHSDDRKKVKQVIDAVRTHGGLDYGTKVMKEYALKADQELQLFPDSVARESLRALIEFTVSRKS
ncbi:MAG: polyprenyl synthetase family protein [Saprospiraceae bacterium]|nr:polyprenyl synthetase family protein [Saprospiraceae bacterium]